MNPNPLYVLSPNLQDYFVDKDTGQPLSSGYVYFYSDINRNILKDIFKISGSPQNYTFVPLNNPVRLGLAGTYIDENGADINVYLYPYNADGEVDLYYVAVFSSGFVPQFDREAWPPFEFADANVEPENLDENWAANYIPNGQFLAHTDIPPASAGAAIGIVQTGITDIAQGGWTFERDDGSAGTDSVTFVRFSSFTPFPTSTPRYQVLIHCITPSAGTTTFKRLAVKFPNVSKFASDTQNYTFFFAAQALSGNLNASVEVVKFYGTGGSPSSTDVIFQGEVTITGNYANYNVTVNFGDNIDKIIGTNDDDYVQVALSFPVDTTFRAQFTDFALVAGEVELDTFPVTTDADMIDRSIAGFLPSPVANGSTLYLSPILTQTGFDYDYSPIGRIEYYITPTIPSNTNLLPCDGAGYLTAGYSALGIPYSRLWNALLITTTLYYGPITGTGINYFTALYQQGVTTGLRFFNNKLGVQTAATNGTMPGGFVFNRISTGFAVHIVNAYLQNQSGTPSVFIKNIATGFVTAPTVGTTGFTLVYDQNYQNRNPIEAEFSIQPSNAAGLAGTYFTFSTPSQDYVPWFKVDGVGAAPGVPGVKLEIDILSNFTNIELAAAITNALNGVAACNITFAAASALSASGGQYWTFTANSINYIVYYVVDGVGSPPIGPVGTIYIAVPTPSTFTATQLRDRTAQVLNSYSVATPSLAGNFLRVVDPNLDLDFGPRGNGVVTDYDNVNGVGSYESYLIAAHNHLGTVLIDGYVAGITPNFIRFGPGVTGTAASQLFGFSTSNSGSSENRPDNTAVNAFIRY